MGDQHDPLGVTISAREIYDQIVGLRDDVRSLVQSNADTGKQLDDHEERIRDIERWKYAVPTATLGAIASAGVTIFTALGGFH
jgi:hypothetical protein